MSILKKFQMKKIFIAIFCGITVANISSALAEVRSIVDIGAQPMNDRSMSPQEAISPDLPDPNNEALAKLYSNIFYRMCGNALAPGGVINVQSTSPYYATKSFWCVTKTLESEGFVVAPYHLQVPAFGDWGFNMAVKADSAFAVDSEDGSGKRIATENIILDSALSTKYLSEDNIQSLFVFGKDEKPQDGEEIAVNQLTKPVMIQYYNEAVRNWE